MGPAADKAEAVGLIHGVRGESGEVVAARSVDVLRPCDYLHKFWSVVLGPFVERILAMLGLAYLVVGRLLENDVLDVVEGSALGKVTLCDVVGVVPVPELTDVLDSDFLRPFSAFSADTADPLLCGSFVVAGRCGVCFACEEIL